MWSGIYVQCFACLTVERLAKAGAKMVIISNSSRRSFVTIEKLKSLGFDPSLFVGTITSGELAHQNLLRSTIILIQVTAVNYMCDIKL